MPHSGPRRQLARLLLCVAAPILSATPVAATQVRDDGPGVAAQPAGVQRMRLGDALVTALSDGTLPLDLNAVLRGIKPEQIDSLLAQGFQRNPVETSINVFLIQMGDRRILVDTGAGELFGPHVGGRLPRALAVVGVRPDDITDVLITHVHSDHSGGLTVGGRMLFPNATIHVGSSDLDFFLGPPKTGRTEDERRLAEEAARTLGPYTKAGKVRPFDRDGIILPGISAQLRPGHTPGTAFYTLDSQGHRLVFIGDTIHAAAVQFPQPAVTIVFDQDQSRARDARQRAFPRFAAESTLLAAPHISFPGVGRIRAEGSGYRWIPIQYGDRATDAYQSGGADLHDLTARLRADHAATRLPPRYRLGAN